jgi:ribosomal protein S18 acetylase RimI-like enzyme
VKRPGTTLLLGPDRPATSERDAVLALTALASAPYDAFVWDTPDRAREVAVRLWDSGAGEVTPASCLIWRETEHVAGALVLLDGRQLRRARISAALALSRTDGFSLSDNERERAACAATALLQVANESLYLARIAVGARWRGRGVARRMVEFLTASAATVATRSVYLEVDAENTAAIALYRSAGFDALTTVRVTGPDHRRLELLQMRAQFPDAIAP